MEKKEEKVFSPNAFDRKASLIKNIKYAVALLLVFDFLFFFLGYRNDITVENIRYLLKYVNISPSVIGSENARVIPIESTDGVQTAIFRQELVVVTKNKVTTYDMNAKEGFSDTVSLSSPAISTGKNFFAVYDRGDNYFALYNSFSKIYEEVTPYPVWDIIISDSGEYSVITAEKGYRSALRVYNTNFENKMNYLTSDKYIICSDTHSGKDVFYVVGCLKNSEEGDFLSSAVILKDGSEDVYMTVEFPSEMILNAKFFDNGNMCVLTDKSVRVLDLAGGELSKISFSSDSLKMFDAGTDYCVLILNENSIGTKHRMIIIDDRGNTLTDTVIDSSVDDISAGGREVLILGSSSVISFKLDDNTLTEHYADKGYTKILSLKKSEAILIYDDNAYIVSTK